jgi:hypothetical protein
MKPATKHKDPLFKDAPLEIQRLNKQAQKELRLKRRAEWMKKQNGN